MRRLFLGSHQPRNVPLAALLFLAGSFVAFVGLLTSQAISLGAGLMFLLWAAYYSLPERLQRTKTALRALSLLAALATTGFALAGFSTYGQALLGALFWVSVLALVVYLTRLKQRWDSRRY